MLSYEPHHEKTCYAICEQQRCRSACASAQSGQHLCCLPRSLVSTFVVCRAVWSAPLLFAAQSGQHLCCLPRSLVSTFVVRRAVWSAPLLFSAQSFVVRCLGSIIPSFYIRNFKLLPSFCGSTGRFVSTLVVNPEDRFSGDRAHMIMCPKDAVKIANSVQ